MTQNQDNNPDRFWLPKLKRPSRLRPGVSGELKLRSKSEFRNVAEDLDVSAPREELTSFNSLPSIWGRPLSMEMVFHLFGESHPVHGQIFEQWQGMLGAIALAEVRGYPLRAELLELGQSREGLAVSLHKLLPAPTHALYRLAEDERKNTNPWRDVYVWFWGSRQEVVRYDWSAVTPSPSFR